MVVTVTRGSTSGSIFDAFDHKGRSTVVSGHPVDAFQGVEVRGGVQDDKSRDWAQVQIWCISGASWVHVLRNLSVIYLFALVFYMCGVYAGFLAYFVQSVDVENEGRVATFVQVLRQLASFSETVRLTAGVVCMEVLLPRAVVTLLVCRGVLEKGGPSLNSVGVVAECFTGAVSLVLFWMASVCALSQPTILCRMTATVFLSSLSALLSYKTEVGWITSRYGLPGMVVSVVMRSVVGMYGVFFLVVAQVVFLLVPYGSGMPMGLVVGVKDASPAGGGVGCTERMTELTRRMGLDMSRVDGYLKPSCLDSSGTVPQGQKESEMLRRFAYVGDRALALALAARATREGWTVEASSRVSQAVLTNAAFTKWFDVVVVDIFSSFVGRSEKRKGTLIEALVGAAFVSGVTLAEIEVFVFTHIAKVNGLEISGTGNFEYGQVS